MWHPLTFPPRFQKGFNPYQILGSELLSWYLRAARICIDAYLSDGGKQHANWTVFGSSGSCFSNICFEFWQHDVKVKVTGSKYLCHTHKIVLSRGLCLGRSQLGSIWPMTDTKLPCAVGVWLVKKRDPRDLLHINQSSLFSPFMQDSGQEK